MTALAVLTIELCLLANLMLTCATLPDPESPTSDQQFVGRPKIYFPFEERYICDGKNEEIASVEVSSPTKGTFIKDVRFYLRFLEIPTYLCPIHYILSTYVLCPIFLDTPTYPKIGHPL